MPSRSRRQAENLTLSERKHLHQTASGYRVPSLSPHYCPRRWSCVGVFETPAQPTAAEAAAPRAGGNGGRSAAWAFMWQSGAQTPGFSIARRSDRNVLLSGEEVAKACGRSRVCIHAGMVWTAVTHSRATGLSASTHFFGSGNTFLTSSVKSGFAPGLSSSASTSFFCSGVSTFARSRTVLSFR